MEMNIQKNGTNGMGQNSGTEENGRISTRTLALIGVMTAVICVLGPLSVPLPFSPVPISLGVLAVYFTIYVLGMKRGMVSCCIYLLIGLVGVPVFTGFSGGPAKLLGPTGGYLTGYIFMALISGYFIDKWNGAVLQSLAGMLLGTLVLYAFGTLWLAYQAKMGLGAALMAGVVPFIPWDLGKLFLALFVGRQLRARLRKAGLI